MNEIELIHEEEFKRTNSILAEFGVDRTHNAITKGEFDERFGAGHEVFTSEGIKQFADTLSKAIAENPESEATLIAQAKEELGSLSCVVVKGEDNELIAMYVREQKEEEESSEEEEE